MLATSSGRCSNNTAIQCRRSSLVLYLLAIVVVCLEIRRGDGARILVHPLSQFFNSRLLNMEKLSMLLRDRGHEVTMLMGDHYLPRNNLTGISIVTFKVSSADCVRGLEVEEVWRMLQLSKLQTFQLMQGRMLTYCEGLLENRALLKSLRDAKFDLYLFDWIEACTKILVDYFNVPSIMYSNYGLTNSWPVFGTPSPYAFVPDIGTGFSDKMSFKERLINTIVSILGELIVDPTRHLQVLRDRHFPDFPWGNDVGRGFDRVSLVISANTHYGFDYPRPLMPHIIPISGLVWTPLKPLSSDLQKFVTEADDGVIVVSFGTLIPKYDPKFAEVLANVFSRLSQRVLWRYVGELPPGLGKNVKLLEWLPQNDLLGHPNVKLFVTHCGASSTWETLYHAVPVVAIPLWADQQAHARKLTERAEIGVQLDMNTLDEAALENAIQEVLNNPKYQTNAKRISSIVRDQQNDPQETFLYWVNYVIRHKGSLHLRSQAAASLSWYQYLLLDIVAFLVLCVTIALTVLYFLCRLVWTCVCCRLYKSLRRQAPLEINGPGRHLTENPNGVCKKIN
ncbi:UDP-glucuronosyltransferase 2C1 [Lingula anatina]|uniref:UDP-glucuronosyltransferase 2C1 n=1 Tax=Lingula anatina TaxID=7574 RepID=A0A1S3HZ14_LINAN|nr:UDP-glucuronosyltransferase 2C1 [Lingula anatina]|eukprot:XP_013390324.1 UDP-glucuronosyltransferase 2C1 [Lingula anatina]